MAALHPRLSLPRRARDAARALGAQRRVLGLRDGHRAGLARDDLRPVLRRGRDLLGRRHGHHAPRADPETVSPGRPHHRSSLRESREAVPAHRNDRGLRLLRGVFHGVVRRSRRRAGRVLVPGVRPLLVGELDDDHLQRVPAPAVVAQEHPDQHPGTVRDLDFRERRDVVRALRDHRRVARRRAVRAVRQLDLLPDVGRLGHHGRELRLVLHVVPLVREELPGGVDLRGERGAARAAARKGEGVVKLANPLTAIFHPPPTPGVLAVFGHLDATVDAIGQLRRGGHTDFTVYSPIPRHEIEDALEQPVSPVRVFTLIGGIAGCAIGAWVTLYMSYDWPLVLGGKPIGSIPPYVVIMFEMTILFGALSTILGILFNALFAARRLGTVAYDPRFTNDKFGIFVPAETARAGQVESLLRGAGAEEVRRA